MSDQFSLRDWHSLYESIGGPNPTLGLAAFASCTLFFGIALCLPHEKAASEQLVQAGSSEQQRLPVYSDFNGWSAVPQIRRSNS